MKAGEPRVFQTWRKVTYQTHLPCPLMNTFHRILAFVCVLSGADTPAQDARVRETLRNAREMAQSGRYDHALRNIDHGLAVTPDHAELVAFRGQLLAVAAQAAGEAGSEKASPTPLVRLPVIAERRAVTGKNFTTETAGIAMLWVEPGEVWMSNPQGSEDDTRVTLTRGYWLGRTEVTQEQVQAVMEHLPPQSQFRGSDRPAERITWLSAVEFCRLMTERERAAGRLPPDYDYTLPTEAQWEYACRAGRPAPSLAELGEVAWFELNSDQQTHPVAQKRPNAWGFYDMHGNVHEMCLDGFHGYPGGHVTDLLIGYDGPSAALMRMVRGGGWNNSAGQCHPGMRYPYLINYAGSGVGFRVALAPVRKPASAATRP